MITSDAHNSVVDHMLQSLNPTATSDNTSFLLDASPPQRHDESLQHIKATIDALSGAQLQSRFSSGSDTSFPKSRFSSFSEAGRTNSSDDQADLRPTDDEVTPTRTRHRPMNASRPVRLGYQHRPEFLHHRRDSSGRSSDHDPQSYSLPSNRSSRSFSFEQPPRFRKSRYGARDQYRAEDSVPHLVPRPKNAQSRANRRSVMLGQYADSSEITNTIVHVAPRELPRSAASLPFLDAAPMPVVSPGPGKDVPALHRRTSNKSLRNLYAKRAPARKEHPAMPSPDIDRSSSIEGKERPGFFRRMFGSSASAPRGSLAADTYSLSQASSTQSTTSSLRLRAGSPAKRAPSPLKPQSISSLQPDTSDSTGRTSKDLHKKPSFFRRRKRSIDTDMPPLPQPRGEAAPSASFFSDDSSDSRTVNRQANGPVLRPGDTLPVKFSPGPVEAPIVYGIRSVDQVHDLADDQGQQLDHGITSEDTQAGHQLDQGITSENTKAAHQMDQGSTSESTKAGQNHHFPEDLGEKPEGKAGKLDPVSNGPSATESAAGASSIGLGIVTDAAKHGSPGSEIFHSATSEVHPLRSDAFPAERRLDLPRVNIEAALDEEKSSVPVENAIQSADNVILDPSRQGSAEANDILENATESYGEQKAPDIVEPTIDPADPHAIQAQSLFDGTEEIVSHLLAASFLGEPGESRDRLRRAYMALFDWQGLNILLALRSLCSRLYLKGESQQIDRVLDAFSCRWCICNPSHGFRSKDVVHTIVYSLLMLNTDLHQVEIEIKMTRTQFIRNTLPIVTRVGTDASLSIELPTGPVKRRSFLVGEKSSGSPVPEPLIRNFDPKLGNWEGQMETVLKDFYLSLRDRPLPIQYAEPSIRRSPSILSKAPSEATTASFARGRDDGRLTTGRWGTSKTRSRPRLQPPSSRRSSIDDGSRATTPSSVSAWSRFSSFGRAAGSSMSTESFSSAISPTRFTHKDYFPESIGFANALSQAIIREEGAPSDHESIRAVPLLEDESLELHGAPWAKEGILKHKHHLDAADKRARDRTWTETFAVVEKGQMRLFSFNLNAKSLRAKSKTNRFRPYGTSQQVVGGGNWADNAERLATFPLRQIVATALPAPGYSKSRPHVWALSLPSGAVHLFECGTPDIVAEFVATVNYWSARLSKEPLVGGVSNVEYGWSEAIVGSIPVPSSPPIVQEEDDGLDRRSMQISMRSARNSVDNALGDTVRPPILTRSSSKIAAEISMSRSAHRLGQDKKLPGDRANISEWTLPPQSTMASALMEVDQVQALASYVQKTEAELLRHNELRGRMLLAYSPRHPNATKAMRNWELKSSYLLSELIKFKTYLEALQSAQSKRDAIYESSVPDKPAEDGGSLKDPVSEHQEV